MTQSHTILTTVKRILPLLPVWFATVVLLWCLSATANSDRKVQEQWQHIGNHDGVELFRAAHEVEGLLPFKAIAELDLPYEPIVMALVDAERKPAWAPKLKATAIHSELSSNRFVYSEYYTTPWPFQDREFLLLGTVLYDDDRIVFSAVNAADGTLAQQDHVTANIQELTFSVIPVSAPGRAWSSPFRAIWAAGFQGLSKRSSRSDGR
jgi:hypothetical protein